MVATHAPITPEQAAARRKEKAQLILETGEIKPTKNGGFYVRAQSEPSTWYYTDAKVCTCPDEAGRERLGFCKHSMAVRLYVARQAAIDEIPAIADDQPEPVLTNDQKLRRARAFVMFIADSERVPLDTEARMSLKDAIKLISEVLNSKTPETIKVDLDYATALLEGVEWA